MPERAPQSANHPAGHPAARAGLALMLFTTLSALGLASSMLAQAPPSTDIYLVELTPQGAGVELGEPINLTDREGYDNQPAFSPDGKTLYYTSEADGQTDLWAIDLADQQAQRVIETAESEYSPTPIPAGSESSGVEALSSVRVEADGTQRLWRFPLDGGEPTPVLETIRPVGYHAWSGRELVLFVLDEPHRLVRTSADQPMAEGRTVAADIGRALHAIPGSRAFSFVHKAGDDGWWLKRLAVEDDEITPLIRLFDGREDVTWSPDGQVWTADGSVLYRACTDCEQDWKPVADLADRGIGEITRLAISADGGRLAFVASRPVPEAPVPSDAAEDTAEDTGEEGESEP